MLCLDTNIAISLLRGGRPDVERRLHEAFEADGSVALSSVVLLELHYGVNKSGNPARARQALDRLLAGPFEILPFTGEDADRAGSMRADLSKRGLTIGPYDVLIAAQAFVRGLTLVTNNVREFSRVGGLQLTDWLSPAP
jgi:tRNA(fMet)-specific endonuclease VapC